MNLDTLFLSNYSHSRTKSAIPLGECFLCLANAPQINTAIYKRGTNIQCGATHKSLKVSPKMLVVKTFIQSKLHLHYWCCYSKPCKANPINCNAESSGFTLYASRNLNENNIKLFEHAHSSSDWWTF